MKEPVEYHQSSGREYITVSAVQGLKAAFKGRGFVYSYFQGVNAPTPVITVHQPWTTQFDLEQKTQAEYLTDESGRISVETRARSPCSGIIASTGEGYIISPAFQLEPVKGQPIVLMLVSPRTKTYNLSVEKTVLAPSNTDSRVTVTVGAGELSCSGRISGHSKVAQIVLNRNPHLRGYKEGFNEKLSELKGEGRMTVIWKPVTRTFEDLVLVFYPFRMFSSDDPYFGGLNGIAKRLGARDPEVAGKFSDYVIGDGSGVDYRLRLKIDRGFGRHDSDETRVTLA